ncbi:SPFH domain-containing protein [Aldersonia sp. NBC_00410]|uniref:hypothetical protein n=1 Tax=Aldersonia sp. NBC_00410 TaxID=2975954 RepID=UPI00224FC8D7|nr:hypothetical protein [Aldersonia sp. NBC_00410]MCX5043476.1 SPFH domain-containing protein [Aldersonia sp. NBC_00410]
MQRLAETFCHATQLVEWIETPSWNASYEYARNHADLFTDPRTLALLETRADEPVIAQHAAIVALTRTMTLTDTYRIVTDPQFVAQTVRTSDDSTAELRRAASPQLRRATAGRVAEDQKVQSNPVDRSRTIWCGWCSDGCPARSEKPCRTSTSAAPNAKRVRASPQTMLPMEPPSTP